jgi:3',5'-cyclic AMP phosphodiesterase CpdA
LDASKDSAYPIHYCFGNHEHYAFSRADIHDKLSPHFLEQYVADAHPSAPLGGVCNPAKLYYDWSPAENWRFISLDCYDVSLIGASSASSKQLAADLLAQHNPNDLNAGGTWFNNLPFNKRRWVPYNGGVGAEQLAWFVSVLAQSRERGEKVVVFCHQPIHAPDKPQSMVWNAEDLLAAIHHSGNVMLWIAGHDHGGQYSRDKKGIHHLVPPAPLECRAPEVAYGHMEVHPDRFTLVWQGKVPKAPLMPWPQDLMFPDGNL